MTEPITIDAAIKDTGEIIAVGRNGLSLPGRALTTGLLLPEDLSFEEWEQVGETLKGVEKSLLWWVGDWLNYGQRNYGEKYTEALDATEYNYQTCCNAKSISKKIELYRRRYNLSWSHHAEVASLASNQQSKFLEKAEVEGWSQKQLREQIRQFQNRKGCEPNEETCTVADLIDLAKSGRKYGSIYADPPWVYNNQATRAATGNHYNGLTVDELCELPIRDLVLPDAHLHLWTTNAFLFECPRIFEAWGFEFRSSLVWVKPQMGIGNYWRNSHEFLLTAIRGNAKRFNDRSLMSWLECDRGRHSSKPEIVRSHIQKASPGPYLELFGRSPADGWSVWGNEVERGLLFHGVEEVA